MDVYLAARAHMITPVDWSIVDKSALDPRQLHQQDAIGCSSQSMNVCFSKKKWPAEDPRSHPNSWADFWDVEKFPGAGARSGATRSGAWRRRPRRTASEDAAFIRWMSIGSSAASIASSLTSRTGWSDNSQAQQLMEQEEVDFYLHDQRPRYPVDPGSQGAFCDMIWNEAIYAGHAEGWIVPAGCPNPRGGMKVLDFVGRAGISRPFSAGLLITRSKNPKAYLAIEPSGSRG